VFYLKDRRRLRKAPKGFLEIVDVEPHQVDRTIRRWARMGYDLHDRRDAEEPGLIAAPGGMVRGGRSDVPRVLLTFVKK
jgi:hypothetical protein